MTGAAPLRAVTLLAENTVGMLDDVCARLEPALGRDLVRVPVGEPDVAESADLVWGCGYLLRQLIDGDQLDAEIVAAPVFEGQERAVYHSVVVTGRDGVGSIAEARAGRLAINEPVSWSGHHALLEHLGRSGMDASLFESVVETGSHAASVDAVAAGIADLAAIDHTVWDWLVASGRVPARVRVIARTRDWPAPPFAVGGRLGREERSRLAGALLALPPGAVDGLAAIAPASRGDYATMAIGSHPVSGGPADGSPRSSRLR